MEANVMEKMSRRNFTGQMLLSLLTLSLVEALSQENLLGKNIDRIAKHWLAEVEEISRAMKNGRAKQIEWQHRSHSQAGSFILILWAAKNSVMARYEYVI